MNARSVFRATICMAVGLTGCGGGGGGGSAGDPMAGIDGGGARVQGPISQFGSIFVNGVEYSTTSATVIVNGNPATDRDLRIGQIVTVAASAAASGATAAATRVEYEPTIDGPVQSVDGVAYELVVAAIRIRVVGNTSFGDGITGIEALHAGDFLEISGYYDGSGAVIASRIERKAQGDLEVHGTVANVDSARKTFAIATLAVDYSAATSIAGFPSGGPRDGDGVEVVGTLSGTTLQASRLELRTSALGGSTGDHAEIEGAVTFVTSPSAFEVGAQKITTASTTVFDDGTAQDVAVARVVEVEGRVDSTGVIAATRVSFREQGDLLLTGAVSAVSTDQRTFNLLGVDVDVDALTRLEDKTGGGTAFSLANLRVADYVEVRAYQRGSRTIATRVTRETLQTEVDLRGRPSALALPHFLLLGQTIETDASTEFRNGGDAIDQVTFFALAATGVRTVRVRGTLIQGTTTINAREARLED